MTSFPAASILNKQHILKRFYIKTLGGPAKNDMQKKATSHFKGLKKIVPKLKQLIIFDYDTEQSYHPEPGNPALFEWKRKNIENYLLVPEVWKRAVLDKRNETAPNLVNQPILEVINDFFVEQNLTLPKGKTWRTVSADVFSAVDGKKLLFEQADSLFQRISIKCGLKINRETLSNNFKPEELHQDVIDLFDMLATTLGV